MTTHNRISECAGMPESVEASEQALFRASLEANFDALLRIRALLLPYREKHLDVALICENIEAYLKTVDSDLSLSSVQGVHGIHVPASLGAIGPVITRLVNVAITRGRPALIRLKAHGQVIVGKINKLLAKLRGSGSGLLAPLVATLGTAAAVGAIFYLAGEAVEKFGTAAEKTGKGALWFGLGIGLFLVALALFKGR